MKIGKPAVKKATCTSVKGSAKSLENLLKRLVLFFHPVTKTLILKLQIFLFHYPNIVQKRAIEAKHMLFPPIYHNQQILYS